MLPAGTPETSYGMQVRSKIDRPESEYPTGEVQTAAGIKRRVIPFTVGEHVFNENLIEGLINHNGMGRLAGVKDRGCRLVERPELIQWLTSEATQSRLSSSDVIWPHRGIKRPKSDYSTLSQLEDLAVLMGFAKSLGFTRHSVQDGSTSLCSDLHPVMEKFVALFDSNNLALNSYYEVSFYARDDVDKLYLHLKHSHAVTLLTPDIIPDQEDPFGRHNFDRVTDPMYSPDGIYIELDGAEDDRAFAGLINRVRLLDPFEEKSSMNFLIRFRKNIPEDQNISDIANYRLVTGSEDRNQLYFSCSVPVTTLKKGELFIELQAPFINCPEPDLDEIFDVEKECKSTRDKLKRNTDGSINNKTNRDLLRQKSIPIVRNTRKTTPEKNGFVGEYLGSGIAQCVFTHAEFNKLAAKKIMHSMNHAASGATIRTLCSTQRMCSCVMTDPLLGKNGEIKFALSPIEYIAVPYRDGAIGADQVYEFDLPEKNVSYGVAASNYPVRVRRIRNSASESDAFNNLDYLPVLPREDCDEPVLSDYHYRMEAMDVNGDSMKPEFYEQDQVTVLGLQRKYDQEEMVECILKDPNEKPEVKFEIIKGILDLIDRCDRFNKMIEEKGNGWVIKCVIDGNFANFAYDRKKHQLIYLDVAPATVTIDGQILPGNQFMMEWIKERHEFISKMSEDPQMSKLFVLVMLTNDLRQLEKIQSRLVRESVSHDSHKEETSSLRDVVSKVSSLLAEDDRFLSWCACHFFSDSEMTMESLSYNEDASSGGRFSQVVSSLFERYIQNPLVDFDQYVDKTDPAESEKIKSLPLSRRMELLRQLSDAAFGHMKRIKKSLAEKSSKKLNGNGVDDHKEDILSKIEYETMMNKAIRGDVIHFFPTTCPKEDMFNESAFAWLKKWEAIHSYKPIEGDSVDSVLGLSRQLLLDAEFDETSDSLMITIPCFQRLVRRIYGKKVDVLLVEPFHGRDKKFRTALYQWRSMCQDKSLRLEECTGVEAFHDTLENLTMDTMILVNRQPENSYLIGNVSETPWSSIFVKDKGEQASKLNCSLPVTYMPCQDGCEKLFFEKVLRGLKELYEIRKERSLGNENSENLSDEDFLKKLVVWLPGSCAETRKVERDVERVFIKMKLSSSIMTRLKPWLRGYVDMIQDEFGREHSPRVYLMMPLPSEDTREYARWMLRLTKDRNGNDISFMNFTSELNMNMLQEKIKASINETSSSKPDFMFIEGGYGYRSGYFLLHDTPVVRVCSGYDEGFFKEIDRIGSVKDLALKSVSVSIPYTSLINGDPVSRSSMECLNEPHGRFFSDR
ncbi:hypothetical protein [Endozoicomonas sp. ALB091]|uniref:hypothetical protein n=1 Tax=Endozoicomonas sp. ALB091 TaxID=3403073 RepID=UPI003BB71806